jgi:hypothetical protein
MNLHKRMVTVMLLLLSVVYTSNLMAQVPSGAPTLQDYLPNGLTGMTQVPAARAMDNLLVASETVGAVTSDETRQYEGLRTEYLRNVARGIEAGSSYNDAISLPIQELVDRTLVFGVGFLPANATQTIVLEAVGLVTQ